MIERWMKEEPSQGTVELGTGSKNEFLETIGELREAFVSKGFKEIAIPLVAEKGELVKARGLSFYLNDFYFLSGSSRYVHWDEGKVAEIVPDLSKDTLVKIKGVFDEYRSGRINARDVPVELVEKAGLLVDQAVKLASKLIPVRMKTTSLAIRRDMASSWLFALKYLYSRYPSPQAYFTLGRIFDPTLEKVKGRYHLSGVIVGQSSVSQVMKILEDVLKGYNLALEFDQRLVGDTLFIPRSFHIISSRGHEFGYVANLSFTSLEKFEIDDPVVIFDLDLVSMYRAMGKEPLSDLYPYLFGEWYIPDNEIAEHLSIARRPETLLGREVLAAMRKTIDLYASQPAPCEFKVYEKEFKDKALEVYVVGYDKRLVGPGFNNELIVYKGDILALPAVGDHEAVLNGARTGIRIGDAVLNYIAREIEKDPERPRVFQYDMATLENSNVFIPRQILNYITHIGADIKLEVPLKLRVEARIKKLWVYRKE